MNGDPLDRMAYEGRTDTIREIVKVLEEIRNALRDIAETLE